MYTYDVKSCALSYAERIWNDRDLSAIDELLDDDCVIHSLLGDHHGKANMKTVVQAWLTGFPDLEVENTQIISDNDLVVLHWKARGTHLGEFKGRKPTGKRVSYAGVTLYRIKDEKIVEYWAYLDMDHILKMISS